MRLKTKQKYPVIVVGLIESDLSKKQWGDVIEKLECEIAARISSIDFSGRNLYSSKEIDEKLAKNLCQAASREVLALGATISIPDVSGPTGGVIGNPHSPISSEESEFEKIAQDLYLTTFTGGPGLIFDCCQDILLKIKKHILVDQGWPDIPQLIEGLSEHRIKRMIGVTDGTGADFPGSIMIYNQGKMEIKHL